MKVTLEVPDTTKVLHTLIMYSKSDDDRTYIVEDYSVAPKDKMIMKYLRLTEDSGYFSIQEEKE